MPPFLLSLFTWFGDLFADKVWEQLQLEDTVADADPILETLEVEDPAVVELNADLLAEFDRMLDADADSLRPFDQAA